MILGPKPRSFKTEHRKFEEMELKAFSKSMSINNNSRIYIAQN